MRWTILCLVLAGCGPSCEEQGGKYAQDGYFYAPMLVGKLIIMQQHPNYVCVMKDKNGN